VTGELANSVELLDETDGYPGAEQLAQVLLAYMDELGLVGRQVTLALIRDAAMAERNLVDRGEPGATDVLSYPTNEPGDVGFPQLPHLGDILISLDTAKRQAAEQGHDLLVELLQLAAHGLTHLRGFDHQSDEEWPPFLQAQRRILQLAEGGA
jgi:probable rRNA maturation factor